MHQLSYLYNRFQLQEDFIMNTTIPFQLLILNDLLNTGSIDKDLYDMAVQKLSAMIGTLNNSNPFPMSA